MKAGSLIVLAAPLLVASILSVGEATSAGKTKTGRTNTQPRNEPNAVESFVKRATQELFDAVAKGDTAVWGDYLSGDALYTDEEGHVMTKAALLAELHPLPAGYHGTIRLAHPKVVISEETAVLTADCMETLELYGQTLETRFHTTGTWVRRLEGWKLLAAQTMVLPSEHRKVDVDPASFGTYAGTYALAPKVTYTVTREGKKLFGQRSGRAKEELLPLGRDRFFRKGANRGEKIFARNATGKIMRMVDRRDNNDLVWTRIE
jgi:hypothetical protein